MENLIKVIETSYPIKCPFCNELIRDDDEEGECFYTAGDCPHLIFEATDYGFEQASPIFWTNMGISADAGTDLKGFHPQDECIDEFTSRSTIPGSIKLAVYSGHGFLGAYFGFAP